MSKIRLKRIPVNIKPGFKTGLFKSRFKTYQISHLNY
nr:MAG TPA: hypothetical protein [Caudoviricetes sp.]